MKHKSELEPLRQTFLDLHMLCLMGGILTAFHNNWTHLTVKWIFMKHHFAGKSKCHPGKDINEVMSYHLNLFNAEWNFPLLSTGPVYFQF